MKRWLIGGVKDRFVAIDSGPEELFGLAFDHLLHHVPLYLEKMGILFRKVLLHFSALHQLTSSIRGQGNLSQL